MWCLTSTLLQREADNSLDMLGDPFDSFTPSSFVPSHYDDDDVYVEDSDLNDVDVDVVTSLPLWARKTLEDSRVDVTNLDVLPSSGP